MSGAPRVLRRELLQGALALAAWSALPSQVRALRALDPAPSPVLMPTLYVSHGSPLLAADPVRGPQLRALGAGLPPVTGVVALTPHYRSRQLELGVIGKGRAGYTFPAALARSLPPDLHYASPDNEALAARVSQLLSPRTLARSDRKFFDHTTWMPLYHLLPNAPVPVLELAHPYVSAPELLQLGQALAPLCAEGVLIMSSGGVTHNLAAMQLFVEPAPPTPRWALEFDAWLVETTTRGDIDALLDYRHKAPAVELAHPDDGDHYDVMLVALGAALGNGASAPTPSFPIAGFEGGSMSSRCVTFAAAR